jgi:hypothetical protein
MQVVPLGADTASRGIARVSATADQERKRRDIDSGAVSEGPLDTPGYLRENVCEQSRPPQPLRRKTRADRPGTRTGRGSCVRADGGLAGAGPGGESR